MFDSICPAPSALPTLSPCPPAGRGVHIWIFAAACRCFEADMDADDAVELITSLMTRDPSSWCEVSDAVRSAYRKLGDEKANPRQVEHRSKWPDVDERARELCLERNGGLGHLSAASPADPAIWLDGGLPMLRRLYAGDAWICAGRSMKEFYTQRLSEWGPAIERMCLVVPSPMTAAEGLTKAGKLSAHTLDNTGPRRFLVVEQDSGSMDLQAGVLLELAKTGLLSLVVFSGNKSIHGWFFCEGQPEESLHEWFRRAVTLGADTAMWTRSQFARLPGATRDNGTPQHTIFYNPLTIRDKQ